MSNKSSTIQTIYDLCKKSFSPSISLSSSSSQIVQKLSSLLDTVTPDDVGLKEENVDDDRGHGLSLPNPFNRAPRWAQPITYMDIHECDSFTMCIFCFPTSAAIPLHDHPGMTVFSKLLYGSLHVKAYDWVEPPQIVKSNGSEHSQEDAGRKCTYYHDYPYSSFSTEGTIDDGKEEYAWLAEIEAPNVYMRSGIYTGPSLQV